MREIITSTPHKLHSLNVDTINKTSFVNYDDSEIKERLGECEDGIDSLNDIVEDLNVVAFSGDYNDLNNKPDLSIYLVESDIDELVSYAYLDSKNYASESYVNTKIAELPIADLSAYVTKVELSDCGYISDIPSEYITDAELSAQSYATKSYVNTGDSQIQAYAYYVAADAKAYSTAFAEVKDGEVVAYFNNKLNDYTTYAAISEMGYINSIPSEYITQDELSANAYLTQHQDLSTYVSKSELSDCGYISSIPSEYVTDSELNSCGYITMADVSACGYISSIPSDYATYAAISDMAYITMADVSSQSYATTSQLPIIDENIIPKENNTYTLGDSSNLYAATYTNAIKWGTTRIYNDNNAVTFSVNNYSGMKVGQNSFSPRAAGNYDLGSSSIPWKNTYSTYIYLNGTNIEDRFTYLVWSGTASQYASLPDYTTYQIYLIQEV